VALLDQTGPFKMLDAGVNAVVHSSWRLIQSSALSLFLRCHWYPQTFATDRKRRHAYHWIRDTHHRWI